MTDVVIPLSKESTTNNIQLRIALRSIAKYAKNVGTIHIYTEANLPWIRNVNVVKMGDPIKDNKDANLINKVIAAAKNGDTAESFMFWSDDQLLTNQLDLDNAPVVYNARQMPHFANPNNKWYFRMRHTLQYIKNNTGRELPFNYDAHTPQPYTKSAALDILQSVPYMEQPGFCINTIYYGMRLVPPNALQDTIKITFEKGNVIIPNKMLTYAGYDEASWHRGLAFFLTGYLYEPCKYEVEGC